MIVAKVHFAISVTVFLIATVLMAKGILSYPEHVHPPLFVVFQRIMNFPFVLLVSYALLLAIKTFQLKIGMYIVFAVIVASISFNSFFWGFCIDKMVCFIRKEKI